MIYLIIKGFTQIIFETLDFLGKKNVSFRINFSFSRIKIFLKCWLLIFNSKFLQTFSQKVNIFPPNHPNKQVLNIAKVIPFPRKKLLNISHVKQSTLFPSHSPQAIRAAEIAIGVGPAAILCVHYSNQLIISIATHSKAKTVSFSLHLKNKEHWNLSQVRSDSLKPNSQQIRKHGSVESHLWVVLNGKDAMRRANGKAKLKAQGQLKNRRDMVLMGDVFLALTGFQKKIYSPDPQQTRVRLLNIRVQTASKIYRLMSTPPEVQNVVSLAKLSSTDLDLYTIAQKSQSSRYNPKRFPAVIMRKTDPKSTILIFKSGKLIIIGAKSQSDAKISADKSAKDISRLLEKKLKVETFNITNIVANADIGWRLDIGALSQGKLAFKDETFPGVIYRMGQPVKAVLIFSSGKIVFTGAKTKADIQNAFQILKKDLAFFKSIKNKD